MIKYMNKSMFSYIDKKKQIISPQDEHKFSFCRICCAKTINTYDSRDVDLVMDQSCVHRELAEAALILNGGDALDAILSLTHDLVNVNTLQEQLDKLCKEDCPQRSSNLLVKSASFK